MLLPAEIKLLVYITNIIKDPEDGAVMFYGYKYGTLPYRSIIFEERKEIINDLPSSVINFTDKSPYTRKTQWDLLPNSEKSSSQYKTITYEKPCSMNDNPGEYYYPVQTINSKKIYEIQDFGLGGG